MLQILLIMKNYVFFALLLLGMSCAKKDDVEPEKLQNIQFRLELSPEILPFSPLRAIPSGGPTDPRVSGEHALFNRLEYLLYRDNDPTPIKRETFKPSDEDFGHYVYDKFKKGTYTACFMAHSAGEVTLNNNNITFSTLEDMFYRRITFVVDGKADITKDVLLERIVSRVEFVATDNVPEEVARLILKVRQVYNTFNIYTGVTSKEHTQLTKEQVFTPQEKQAGKKNKHQFYTLVPEGSTIDECHLLSLSNGGDTIRLRSVKDIPIAMNRLIRYKGVLYSPDTPEGTFEISVHDNGAWADSTEIVLE